MKNLYLSLIILGFGITSHAQVRLSNSSTVLNATDGSAFLDASSSPLYQKADNIGKGLLFPAVDLTKFTAFKGAPVGRPTSYPDFYDGMIVYNIATEGVVGGTLAGDSGLTQGTLVRGYWYYDNPKVDGVTRTVKTGTWRPLTPQAGDSKVIINSNVENTTNLIIDGKPVYAYKGTFTMAAGSTAKIDLQLPDLVKNSADGLYRITIFQGVDANKKYYANGVYSLDVATGLAVTGSPGISSRYPDGTYEYVIEYLKKATP